MAVNGVDQSLRAMIFRPRHEALRLYREILKTANKHLKFPDNKGRLWSDKIRESARMEFEQARYESDPEVIGRMLLGGRQALNEVKQKIALKQMELLQGKTPPSNSPNNNKR